ncbi:MAG: hypothetical protein HWD58_03345 [Bacteroidota bacterium]|nr:MAG: hypothetical protein HWD58_03345 [Bacteroidota bacterium]
MKYLILLAAAFICIKSKGQTIEKILRLGKAAWNLNEPAITCHPLDRSRLLLQPTPTMYFIKKERKKFHHYRVESEFGVYGDPVLWYSSSGLCYFVHLAKNKEKNGRRVLTELLYSAVRILGKRLMQAPASD